MFQEILIILSLVGLQQSQISPKLAVPELEINTDTKKIFPERMVADGIAYSLKCLLITKHQPSFPLTLKIGENAVVVPEKDQLERRVPGNTDQIKYSLRAQYAPVAKDNGKDIFCIANFSSGGTISKKYRIPIATAANPPEVSGPKAVVSETSRIWTCLVTGGSHRAPKVEWKFGNGEKIAPDLYSSTVSEETSQYGIIMFNVKNTLHLPIPKNQKDFNLTCAFNHVIHRDGVINQTSFSVTALCCGPKINCTAPPLLVNDTLTCSCSVTGLPDPAKLTWPGHSDDASFTMKCVTQDDNGSRFFCKMEYNEFEINSSEYILRVVNSTEGGDSHDYHDRHHNSPYLLPIMLGTVALAVTALLAMQVGLYMFCKHRNTSNHAAELSRSKPTDGSLSTAAGASQKSARAGQSLSYQVSVSQKSEVSGGSSAAVSEVTSEAATDATSEAATDATSKAATDATSETATDTTTGAASETATDTAPKSPSKKGV